VSRGDDALDSRQPSRRGRRFLIALSLAVALTALACVSADLTTSTSGPPLVTGTPAPETEAAETPPVVPTFTPTPAATVTPAATADPQITRESIHLFPAPLAGGDWLSVDVDPLYLDSGGASQPATVTLQLSSGSVYTAEVEPAGLTGASQARFIWIEQIPADGAALVVTVTLTLEPKTDDPVPANNRVVISTAVEPASTLAPPEPSVTWAVTETEGFELHYLTGSAAERDLDAIVLQAQQAYSDVTRTLDGGADPVDLYLLDRVVGQGGYASAEWVAVSYVDRKYSPTLLGSVLRHELVHRLDGDLGCDGAPSMVREGLAVMLAGGHYRPESLRGKAAALLVMPQYLPVRTLVEDFYTHQHEVAYLEAGALVSYLLDRVGWEALPAFCEAASDDTLAGAGDGARWEAALKAVGLADTAAFESAWHAWLLQGKAPSAAAATVEAFELELRLMDAMRAYQLLHDPAAHFLEGILFSPAEAERLGITADFVRRPRNVSAIAYELVLALAQEAATAGDTALLGLLLADIESGLEGRVASSGFIDDAAAIAAEVLARGWEPYHLVVVSNSVYDVLVLDQQSWPRQAELVAQEQGGVWSLAGVQLGD